YSPVLNTIVSHIYRNNVWKQMNVISHLSLCPRQVFHQPVAVTFLSRFFERLPQVFGNSEKTCSTLSLLAIKQQVLNFVRELFNRCCEIESVSCRDDLQLMDQIL